MEVTRCDKCADRLARAESLISEHRLAAVYGNVGGDKLDAALAALDVLGIRDDRTAVLTRTPTATRELVDALAHVGAAASWTAGIVLGGDPMSSASKRWATVDVELTRAAAEEYRSLIHRRAEVPFPFAPPSSEGELAGCLLCGIGTLTLKESDARAAWGSQRLAEPGQLGGRIRPEPLKGYLCPVCRDSVQATGGSVGMSAMERAVLKHLGYRVAGGRIESWPAVRAWAALRPGTKPNAAPWAHLDLSAVARGLDSAPYIERAHKARR